MWVSRLSCRLAKETRDVLVSVEGSAIATIISTIIDNEFQRIEEYTLVLFIIIPTKNRGG